MNRPKSLLGLSDRSCGILNLPSTETGCRSAWGNMETILKLLAGIVGGFLVVYGVSSYRAIIEGQFSWDEPYAFWTAIAATGMVLFMANAAWHVKQDHPKAFGLVQIFIGCTILLLQLGAGDSSAASHAAFPVQFFAALFFFVSGFESWRSSRAIRNGTPAR